MMIVDERAGKEGPRDAARIESWSNVASGGKRMLPGLAAGSTPSQIARSGYRRVRLL
jgi:hypothetical protein